MNPHFHHPHHPHHPAHLHHHHHHRFARHRGLQHQLFIGFGLAILCAMLTSAAIFSTFHETFAAHRFLRFSTFVVTGVLLWALSGLLARRIAWPLSLLSRAVRAFGEGKLDTRASVPVFGARELRELGHAWNEMAERIESQMKNQTELLGAVSHELRTPLARQRVLLATLADAGASPDLVAKLEREVVEMDELVGELLAGARVDAKALVTRKLDVRDVVRECVERSGVSVVEIDVPEAARQAEADATLLARALIVLLLNAKKHGGPGIRVRIARELQKLVFTVEDDGPGFSPEDAARAFEPFVRGRNAELDENRGVGLGLYLVRRIAQAHGGTVYIETNPTRVTFTIAG